MKKKIKAESQISDEELYAQCMERIKRRMDVIGKFISASRTTGFLITDVEFLALQFRKVLEGIALASICAHREDYAKLRQDIGKDWNARLIVSDIERLNPNFYPRPIENNDIVDPMSGLPSWVNKASGFLTKSQYLRYYERSAALLHEANPFSRSNHDLKQLRTEFTAWYALLIGLLNRHTIELTDEKLLYVIMKSDTDNKVHVQSFERVKENVIAQTVN